MRTTMLALLAALGCLLATASAIAETTTRVFPQSTGVQCSGAAMEGVSTSSSFNSTTGNSEWLRKEFRIADSAKPAGREVRRPFAGLMGNLTQSRADELYAYRDSLIQHGWDPHNAAVLMLKHQEALERLDRVEAELETARRHEAGQEMHRNNLARQACLQSCENNFRSAEARGDLSPNRLTGLTPIATLQLCTLRCHLGFPR